jgi:hypothetical protein
MAMKKLALFVLTLTLFASGCEQLSDETAPSYNTSLIAVEGIITNERINHKITITKPYKTQNEQAEPVSNAMVTISDGETSATLTEFPSGSGHYYTPAFRAVVAKTYTLTIQYHGKQYVAQDASLPVEPLQPIKFYSVEDRYALDNQTSGQSPSFIDHAISWKNSAGCIEADRCEGRVIFYDLKNIDVHDIYKPKKEEFYFPKGTVIIRKKYSVSPAFKAFLRSMLSETEWRGGVFDVQRAEVPSNVGGGAVGFFAVTSVVSDTTIVQ